VGKRIYVGNLSYSTTDDQLRDLFAAYGTVASANVVTDRLSGDSRGFGFVEMGSADEARTAVTALDGKELGGRQLKISEAKERAAGGGRERSSQGGGYGRDRY
jgi:RNA recognition motif-containing protein